ncbi:MAG: AMP-binding protein, partial [Deltaproteobacteria bacterium]|nr:AMP-binding protein [Deltaproteobacteria bacterium]
SLTFGEVNERANRLANGLGELGLKPGARIATLGRNSLNFAEILFGLIKGCFVQLFLNPRLLPADLAFQINDSEISAIIVEQYYAEVIDSIREQVKTVKHFICFHGTHPRMVDYEKLLSSASAKEPETELNLDDLGEIHYTGGTTGAPKGVLLPYRNRFAVARNILLDGFTDLNSSDRFMALQPLYHGAGWFLLPAWIRGATHYIVPRYDPEIALEVIEKHRITTIKTIPTVLIRLIDSPDIKKRDLSSIRTIFYGAEPMLVNRLKEAYEILGPVFVQGYGQMEAAASISILKKEDHFFGDPKREKVLSSVGRAMTFVQVKIIDEEGKELPPGEIGEVVVTGDHIMIGYLNRPEATAEKKRDGWIYTGDLGTIDEEGYIYLTGGRKSEMIISGGLNIYPHEVEQVLCQHPAVREAAVIGVADLKWGEAVKACVVLKEGQKVSEQELIDFCKKGLISYKCPRFVHFIGELPRTGAGKVSYGDLRKRYRK